MATSALRHSRRAALVVSTALVVFAAAAGQAASYRVYPLPIASPDHGSRVLLVDPHDAEASPFGWHDTNGVPGPEHTILRGNNVWVYLDQNADNMPDGPGPDGGSGLVFDHPAAPGSVPPITYAEALATNAFYLGNRMHDILWHHGFREADGNFQENNYGNGGLGGDAMRIEIFDGSGTNNANATGTVDGTPPRMQMFVWNMTNPHREGSFDATVMGWAYMESVQRRLATTPACAGSTENPTSGTSDWFGTLISNDFAATTSATPRGMATWLLGQPVDGTGIRLYPYSSDMAVNPVTYADLPGPNAPTRGAVYASALWDLTWRLVEREGASGDLVTGDGGENRMLRLVVEALKVQACNGGMVDARDAILQADQNLFEGAYHCDIWQAFARRGLGASAVQGSAGSASDNTAAFDLPDGPCADGIFADGFEGEPPEPVWTQFCAAPGIIQLPAGQPGTTSGPASIYPIPITVSGMPASLAGVRVQVFGLAHTFPDDLDMLLVGPGGQNLVVQSDVGGGDDVLNLSYVIDDAGSALLPDSGPLTAGTFRPSNAGAGDAFPAPAPAGPHNNPAPAGSATLGSVFGGTNPNGTWNLFIVDDANADSGSLAGVCLEIGSLP